MTAATVLPLILLIATLFAAAIVYGNAVLDDVVDRARADRDMRESIEAERRKAAALRDGRVGR